jgi:hypothetical protein
VARKTAKLGKAELELLAQIQPAAWKTAAAHRRFMKTLAKEGKPVQDALKDLEMGGWIEKQGEVWLPTETGYLALMSTPRKQAA